MSIYPSGDPWDKGRGSASPSSQWDMADPATGTGLSDAQKVKIQTREQLQWLLQNISKEDARELRLMQQKATYKYGFTYGLPFAAVTVGWMEYTRRKSGKPFTFARGTIVYPLAIGWCVFAGGLVSMKLSGGFREIGDHLDRLYSKYSNAIVPGGPAPSGSAPLTHAQLRAAHRAGVQQGQDANKMDSADQPQQELEPRQIMKPKIRPHPQEQRPSASGDDIWARYGLSPPPPADSTSKPTTTTSF